MQGNVIALFFLQISVLIFLSLTLHA